MKTFITTFIISLLAITTQVSADSNVQMCKTFIKQAHTYSATMKNESDYDKTLTFYKGKIAANCGPIVSKPIYDIDYFAQVKAKNSAATIEGCKTAIAMATHLTLITSKGFHKPPWKPLLSIQPN